MVTRRGLASLAAAAAAVAAAAAASTLTPAAAAVWSSESSLERAAGRGAGCAAAAPATPFNASALGTYSAAFECYRPRSPLRLIVRSKAVVMTDEDGGGYNVACAGDVLALRWGRAWERRPYFNIKPGVDINAAFGSYNLPARFGGSCNAVRAELGIADVEVEPWGAARTDFVRLLCLMVRLARRVRDFRCDSINGPVRFEPAVLDTPLASLVVFLESIAYRYNVPV
ncbi:hypothetical protein I4F81_007967 [Pyropia yezoensis]|uniref:Uncharacterized protein n=1 Tax=Pyropia yezoensis TaxID=2788 RepID=A0ACC3C616_PYRYE|nr:hypothetical protein I4F81_007967 [Neopyropia yezoensis]